MSKNLKLKGGEEKTMRKLTAILGIVVVAMAMILVAGQAQAQVIPADIVFIIDESGSMGGDQAEVIANLGTFTGALETAGIDARYGLVGFGQGGSTSANNIRLVSDLTDKSGIATALGTLVASGSFEPGFEATAFALNNITWRSGAVKNLILITDEDSDGTEGGADALLTRLDALWNGIINANDPDSPAGDYTVLAADHGGTTFDIEAFRADPGPFFVNFSNTKVQEIIDKGDGEDVIPEPASMLLFGTGLFGLIGFRRKK